MKRQCKNCEAYFNPRTIADFSGECRYNPPTINPHDISEMALDLLLEHGYGTGFPPASASHWCLKFIEKKDENRDS